MNDCKDNSMKYIPLYHHEQVPFQPFQDSSTTVKLNTSLSTPNETNHHHHHHNMNNSNQQQHHNNNNNNSTTYDLQDIIMCYQSQPELLRLILSSKLEEDKRRAEEAKLKAKELDLLIIQQQQQLLSTSSSSSSTSTSNTPALSSPSTSSSSIHFASTSDISFSTSPSSHLVTHCNTNASSFSFQPIHHQNNNNSNNNNDHHLDEEDNSSLPFQYLNQPMTNLMTSPTVSQKSNPFHLKLNLTNNNNNNNNQDLMNSYHTPSSSTLLNDPPHPLCSSNEMNSSPFSTPNLISPISEITNPDMNPSSSYPSHPSHYNNNHNNTRYDPYYQQQHRQKRKREMQAITKIVETREYPYIDGYSWRNNGNTIQKKTGNKSVYYKCANSVNVSIFIFIEALFFLY
ncbi:unnamed protein product [Cunninghamella blakesleeana]